MHRFMSLQALPQPYVLFVGDITVARFAKTAFGLADWARERCVGECAITDDAVTTGLPRMSLAQAKERGAKSLVLGVAPIGGAISPAWIATLVAAMEHGLDLVSGMHTPLESIPALADAAAKTSRRLINVRQPPAGLSTGTGRRRSGMRLLTVGTDCALGKKYTALSLTREFKKRGVAADFRATGQTGIMIAGSGIPIDSVVADFIAGAAEVLSPDAAADHWDVVEGQGSVFHPLYSGVSLGLMHGTQPDVLVMCHEVERDRVLGLPDYATPSIAEAIELTVRLARRTNPGARCAGVSLNTYGLEDGKAREVLAQQSSALGLPVADPLRAGAELDRLVTACLS
jgi:uncharacterized NAD-dependent epimerase/dehydratase family protein